MACSRHQIKTAPATDIASTVVGLPAGGRVQRALTMCTTGSGRSWLSLGRKRSVMKCSAFCSSCSYATGSCCGRKSTGGAPYIAAICILGSTCTRCSWSWGLRCQGALVSAYIAATNPIEILCQRTSPPSVSWAARSTRRSWSSGLRFQDALVSAYIAAICTLGCTCTRCSWAWGLRCQGALVSAYVAVSCTLGSTCTRCSWSWGLRCQGALVSAYIAATNPIEILCQRTSPPSVSWAARCTRRS